MPNLIAAAAAFLAIHLLISGTRLRAAISGRIGEGPYMGLFSLTSILLLAWLATAYGAAHDAPGNDILWDITPATRWLQLALMLPASLLVVIGLATPNPTSVRQEGTLARPDVARGVLRVTRHPFLWGVAIWALGHLTVSGDAASLVLFGSLLALALFGTASIDAKRRWALGPKWSAFAAQTSNAPFLAIAQGRQRLDLREIGALRIALGVAAWAALTWGHPYLFGVAALP